MREYVGKAWGGVVPPDAFVIVTAANSFRPTEKMQKLPFEKQKALSYGSPKTRHQAVRDGYFTLVDCLSAVAQTPERVCHYVQAVDPPWLVASSRCTSRCTSSIRRISTVG
jgi:hypothetical protein